MKTYKGNKQLKAVLARLRDTNGIDLVNGVNESVYIPSTDKILTDITLSFTSSKNPKMLTDILFSKKYNQ